MRYLVVFFWTFALGQVVGYIGGALSGGSYDFKMTTILSLATRYYFINCTLCSTERNQTK